MDSFRRLAAASTIATIILVTIGGLVRATKSGLGCGTDWPECSGKLVPALADRALIIEYSHRLAAFAVVVLLASLVVLAVGNRRTAPHLVLPSVGALGLVLFQAVLGAVVVFLELKAESVVLHLTTALLLLALLIRTTIAAYSLDRGPIGRADHGLRRQAITVAASVLLVLIAGSYVTGRDAGLAFTDWPLMGGSLLPALGIELQALNFLHRALAALVGIGLGIFAAQTIRKKRELPLQARLVHAAVGLYALEVLVGALNVWTKLNALVVTSHLLLGALVWSSLVAVAVVSREAPEVTEARSESTGHEPALETSG